MADSPEVLFRLLLASAAVTCTFFIAEGVTDLLRADLEAGSSPQPAPSRASLAVSARKDSTPDARIAFTRGTHEAKRAPAEPIDAPPAPKARAQPSPTPPRSDSPSIEPCRMDLRIVGSAYLRSRAGDSLVVLSGPKGQTGPHSVGSWVGDRTIAAIYPTAIVLRDASGAMCRIAMSTEYARRVAGDEQRVDSRKDARAKLKARAAARKAQAAKRKKR